MLSPPRLICKSLTTNFKLEKSLSQVTCVPGIARITTATSRNTSVPNVQVRECQKSRIYNHSFLNFGLIEIHRARTSSHRQTFHDYYFELS